MSLNERKRGAGQTFFAAPSIYGGNVLLFDSGSASKVLIMTTPSKATTQSDRVCTRQETEKSYTLKINGNDRENVTQEDSTIDITGSITVGTRLFCAADPVLPVGAELSGGGFGRRELARSIFQTESIQGEDLQSYFDLGPLAALDDLDLNRPRRLPIMEPTAGVRVLGELVWEVVRLREFSTRPSRLDCLFLWKREVDARDWFSRRTWPSGLYEVEVTQTPNRVFVADLGLVQFSSPDGTVLGLMERARRYWSQDGSTSCNPEVLLEGTVEIRREYAL